MTWYLIILVSLSITNVSVPVDIAMRIELPNEQACVEALESLDVKSEGPEGDGGIRAKCFPNPGGGTAGLPEDEGGKG